MSGPVAGLDLSLSSTGVAVLAADGSPLRLETLAPERGGEDRYEEIAARVVQDLLTLNAREAVLEKFLAGASSANVAKFAVLHFCVTRALARAGVAHSYVTPQQLKLFVAGRADARKEEMREGVLKQWGLDLAQHDVADAYGLARLGLALRAAESGADLDLPEPGRRVVKLLLQDLRAKKAQPAPAGKRRARA